jgi:hypothetical protein
MHALGLALLEVMDKEWPVPFMWTAFLILGLAAASLAHRSIAGSLGITALAVVVAWAQYSEITDPTIAPAIRSEAGDAYFVHAHASMAVGLGLCGAGLVWAVGKRLRNRRVAA